MDFAWVSSYLQLLASGALQTFLLLVISVVLGFTFAICLALAQISRFRGLRAISRSYCTFFRGTPLLIQLWLLYYGVGSLLPMIPGLRASIFWGVLRDGFFFAALGLTLNYAAYEAEVLRGALLAVPKGELEAGRAFGMSGWKLLRRIWLPRAIRIALPTIAGEVVLQLKATPLVFSVTVMDLYGVAYKIRQDTLLIYEPLVVVTVFYVLVAIVVGRVFKVIEAQVPIRR